MSENTNNPGPTSDDLHDATHHSHDHADHDHADHGGSAATGAGLGAGEPSTFEPEEDPTTVPDDADR